MRLYLLMMGLDTPETCRGSRNILRISCASSWFFFTHLYRDARSTKHKEKSIGQSKQSQTILLLPDQSGASTPRSNLLAPL